MNITIRLATPQDALDMAEVIMRSWEEAYKDIIPRDFIIEMNATRPALYKRVITEDNQNSYVIECDGKIAGIMKISVPQDSDVDDEYYELHYIYLHPEYYRKGIGTKALEFAFKKARAIKKRYMILWVLKDNINSIKFYEKQGFIADGVTKTVEYGKVLGDIRMRKSLGDFQKK